MNNGPHSYGGRAALHALNLWSRFGFAPPSAPRFAIGTSGTRSFIQRDPATGLAIGGIRLPMIAVPVETNTGERPPGALAANIFCVLLGGRDPWNNNTDAWDGRPGFDPSPTPEPVLSSLYPTKGAYVSKFVAAALDSVKQGYLRPADFGEVVSGAVQG